jgi:hypothetical protein
LFEQRITDEQVAAARAQIDAGASLRTAAAAIGCAPSTLSVRISKAKAAEARARALVGIGDREPPAALNPVVEVLCGALQATKQNGQPDWTVRVSAARTLATLYPEEVEPVPEPAPEAATTVYDLPAGRGPILHQAPPPLLGATGSSQPPAEPEVEPGTYLLEHDDKMILLVRHAPDGDAPARLLTSHHAAAEIVRAFGGDPSFLTTLPTSNQQPDSA